MTKSIKKIYYFSSTHWDREWYRPFQEFRFHLVERINEIIEVLEENPDFSTFIMDGQTIVLDDFSRIEPGKKERLRKLIEDGRIVVGPWYTMPDEYLLSGESLIRNLMIGHDLAKEYGAKSMKYGYICDIFGHIAQMPQIFNGFEIEGALLGRGTNYHNCPAHFIWESPDGSSCITFKVPEETGYGSFWYDVYFDYQIGKDPDKENIIARACQYVEKEGKRSDIPYIVLMDGMDHERIHRIAPWVASRLSEVYDCPVVFENMENLLKDLKAYESQMPVKKGELNETAKVPSNHNMLITNTLSSRYDLKIKNDECEILLEKWVLPLAAQARLKGIYVQKTYEDLAYKYLIQCHPHDSICGCSVDEVHRDMHYRFRQVKSISNSVIGKVMHEELGQADYCSSSNNRKLSVLNPLPYKRHETITVTIDFNMDYKSEFADPSSPEVRNGFKLMDSTGKEIPYNLVKILKNRFTDRPGELYRYQADLYTISFEAQLSPMGYTEYLLVPYEKPIRYLERMSTSPTSCENEYLSLNINADGTIDILDKDTGKRYSRLLSYLDDGEIGDGWFHVNPVEDTVVFSQGSPCTIEKVDDGPASCTFKVTHYMRVPERMNKGVNGYSRSHERVDLKISSLVTLSKGHRWVDVKTSIDNIAKDHRLRLNIPTGIGTDTYYASQAFYFVERKTGFNRNTGNWKEADLPEKAFDGIVMKRDDQGDGLAFISAGGLHECAALDDGEGSILITLLRSFSKTHLTDGEPDGQLQQPLEFGYRLMPVRQGDSFGDLIRAKDCLQIGIKSATQRVSQDYLISEKSEAFTLYGDNIVLSLMKTPEDQQEGSIIIRCSNYSDDISEGFFECPSTIKEAFETNMLEENIGAAEFSGNSLNLTLKPWEIKTFRVTL